MNRNVNAISGRLSLRQPQRESLEILAHVTELLPPRQEIDLAAALDVIRSEYPSVTDFEREFPSLCFALATGVGKTRLMGAFVSYLRLEHGIRNFFVLAPNLTIYNKLIADFTPNTPKYVLQGIGEFASDPPEVITGDTYEKGRGVRVPTLNLPGYSDDRVHINIFNISKINSEVRGGKEPRVKRLQEALGMSYFEYLAGLNDLTLIMDESHRYRASAGVRAINELKPILGLELTATPQMEAAGGPTPFKNIIYSYPLSCALSDGFVKEPAVATRENFNAASYSPAQLERLKLEDGVRIHEDTKVELEVYARQYDKQIVKPFMLVVAQDTEHADSLLASIKSYDFFEGRYAERVITVHSNQQGEERDETVQQLLNVENPDNPTEIVIHVNMLKEGWDVTNLYTIVPLRAASSRTLVEQSIGRGLRLPYGKRVGVPAVDRLTIVAHDKFQAIIDEANNPNSIIRTGIYIGRDVAGERKEAVVVAPVMQQVVSGGKNESGIIAFPTKVEQDIARVTIELIPNYERLPRSAALTDAGVQADIVRDVRAAYTPIQGALEGITDPSDIEEIVANVTRLYIDKSIDIPRITVVPTGEVTFGYHDFDMDVTGLWLQPVDSEILIQYLTTNQQLRMQAGLSVIPEALLTDYIVRELIDYPDICYDEHADLLYKLAGQVVARLESYLKTDDQVHNVVRYYDKKLAGLIHSQMQGSFWQSETEYEAIVSKGFTTLRPANYSTPAGQAILNFRNPVEDRLYIRGMLFGGFAKCLYPTQRFQSDAERRFAVVCENSAEALKWFKPSSGQFQIDYKGGRLYEPDFVVEALTSKLICEPKRASEMQDEDVQVKARAARLWCQRATEHAETNGGKPWTYLLIPHDAITAASALQGLQAEFTFSG